MGGQGLSDVVLVAEILHKVLAKGEYVLLAASNGRNGEGNHLEAVVEILPKEPLFHQLPQILVGGGNKTEINFFLGCGANSGDIFVLQGEQQLSLGGQGEGVDLVQKKCASMGRLNHPHFPGLICPGKRPFLIAEQLRLDEVFRECGAVEGDHGFVAPAAALVNVIGDDFLPGTGFSANQDCGVQWGNVPCNGEQIFKGLAFRNNGLLIAALPFAVAGHSNNLLILKDGLTLLLKGGDVLHHVDDVLDISVGVKDGRAYRKAEPGVSLVILKVPIVLEALYTALFFHNQIKDTAAEGVGKVVYVGLQKLTPGGLRQRTRVVFTNL